MQVSRLRRLIAVAAVVAVLVTACSADPELETYDAALLVPGPLLGAAPATVIERFEGESRGLSPDGEVLLVGIEASTAAGDFCAIETATRRTRFCEFDPTVLLPFEHAQFSLSGEVAVLGNRANPDVFVLDPATGEVENITDDGVLEITPEEFGQGPIDRLPAFSPSGDRIVFWRNETDDEVTRLGLYDRTASESLTVIELPTKPLPDGVRLAKVFAPPLMLDESRALIGAEDVLLEVNFDTGSVTEVFNYATSFAPNYDLVGIDGVSTLHPVVGLGGRRVLLFDFDSFVALNQTGGQGGYGSGYYIGDLADESLEPLFELGPVDDGWFGPLAVMMAGDSQLVVSWLDLSERGDADLGTYHLSLLDLVAEDFPVEPRELPQLWQGDPDDTAQWFSHAPGQLVRVSSQGTVVVTTRGTDGPETLLLELAPG